MALASLLCPQGLHAGTRPPSSNQRPSAMGRDEVVLFFALCAQLPPNCLFWCCTPPKANVNRAPAKIHCADCPTSPPPRPLSPSAFVFPLLFHLLTYLYTTPSLSLPFPSSSFSSRLSFQISPSASDSSQSPTATTYTSCFLDTCSTADFHLIHNVPTPEPSRTRVFDVGCSFLPKCHL